jgi:cellulose synthase/poly-beta-1,6-N-acetylglucosamine synthase-like glycosyltransferase
MMVALFLLSLLAIAYVYAGYPVALRALVRLRGARPVSRRPIEPRVALVISAFNEAPVIAGKIENALALDYPADRLRIAVVSDASTDDTDETVRRYADRGVRLVRMAERRGKTAGLNAAVPQLDAEIIVFTDANAMFRPDALRMLIRNFADPSVGCVTGEAKYVAGDGTVADAGERRYWSYEGNLKRLESEIGSMVGGDGAIYAIRAPLWRTLPETAINDFLNPLQIVAAGWRNVYEPDAVCFEETAGEFRREYRRRVRIVSRSWRAVFQAEGVLNPFRVGLFAWCLFSHKVLRWFSGAFAAVAAVTGLAIAVQLDQALRLLPLVLAGLAAAAVVPALRRIAAGAGYGAVVSLASVVGVVNGTLGRVSGTWAPPRLPQEGSR